MSDEQAVSQHGSAHILDVTQRFRDCVASVSVKVSTDWVPTANERNNLVFLCFKYLLGRPNRYRDLAAIEMMAPNIVSVADLRERYIPVVADMLWDHWLGEPEDPSIELVTDYCLAVCDYLYRNEFTERNSLTK